MYLGWRPGHNVDIIAVAINYHHSINFLSLALINRPSSVAYGLSLWILRERKTMEILLLLSILAAGFSIATEVQVQDFESFPYCNPFLMSIIKSR